MEKRKRHENRSKEEWEGLFEEYKKSGLSRSRFCTLKNLSRASFHIWHQIFTTLANQSGKNGKFIPITISDVGSINSEIRLGCDNPDSIKSGFQVQMPHGLRIEFARGASVSELKAVVGVLYAIS